MLEKDIQKKILARLRAAGWRAHKVSDRFVTGLPDITALKNGVHLDIEVKRPGEKPSPRQELQIRDILAHGGHAAVASSVEEAMAIATRALECRGTGCGRYQDGAGCETCNLTVPGEAYS